MKKFQMPNAKIKRNVLLKNYTSFRIGGKAKYFYTAKNKEDLIKAILLAKKFRLPFFILGSGSNLLVSDKGYRGLVINFQFSPALLQKGGVQSIFNSKIFKIVAGAGLSLGKLVNISVGRGLTGMEWAAGIPGTIGGAVCGNAGAFKKSMKDVVESVEVFDAETEKVKIFKNKNCRFEYRSSIFKRNKNLIILSAKIQLKKGKKEEIQEKMKEYLNERKKTQPLDFPSAGSIFQNPPKFSAGELIEKCGLKGKRIGGAKISEKHANFIVNLGNAKAGDVVGLINLIKQKVKKNFGMTLEEEIEYLGFEN